MIDFVNLVTDSKRLQVLTNGYTHKYQPLTEKRI